MDKKVQALVIYYNILMKQIILMESLGDFTRAEDIRGWAVKLRIQITEEKYKIVGVKYPETGLVFIAEKDKE
jgi:hypothetical protein